jgi:NADPH:quinone reductase-like Zn-dependent oxidoreductase
MPRAVVFHRLGGPEVLEIGEIAVGPPAPGEVQIRVKAFGLNRAEAQFRAGLYIEDADLPSGLGLEAAGVVESLGSGVATFSPGDRIAVIPPISMKARPVHAELINFPAVMLVRLPQEQSFEAAAATWMAFLTAYGALVDIAEVRAGDHVVVTAASSSVGLAALQVIRASGATSIAVTRTAQKREALRLAGADHVVVADGADIADEILKITGASGPRVAFDPVGGAMVAPLATAAAVGGVIIGYGALDARPIMIPSTVMLGKRLTLRGYLVHEVVSDPARLEKAKAFVLQGLASGAFRPTIAKTFPFDAIAEAHAYLESNVQVGKLVVTV